MGSVLVKDDCFVFFDMDDTLIEWTVSWSDAFVQAAGSVGVTVHPAKSLAALKRAFTTFYHDCIEEHAKSGDERAFWLDYDGRVLESLGVTSGLAEAREQVVDLLMQPGSRRLYVEVPEVLQALSEQGIKLGIITSRPLAEPDLTALGIRKYFHPLIDAFTAKSAKSKGHMFHLAAEVVEGISAWHVGDNYEDDVVRARSAGFRPVLVDRRGECDGLDCPKVRNLWELVTLLQEAKG